MDLEFKAETILKSYKKNDKKNSSKAKEIFMKKIENSKRKNYVAEKIIRPETLIHQHINKVKNYQYFKSKSAKKFKNIDKVNSAKVLFIIRIRGNADISKQQKYILNSLHLNKQHEGTFILPTTENLEKLKKIENYIMFGEISKDIIKDLITKRTYLNKGKELKPLKSNKDVEDFFGDIGLICVDDIVYEILIGSSNVPKIINIIKKFKLNKPTNGYINKYKPAEKGGSWGYIEKDNYAEIIKVMI